MKTAIFQLDIGHMVVNQPCIQSVEKYCKRIGAEHFVGTDIKIRQIHFFFEKLQALQLFHLGFDQVLYLDGDVMVCPKAENVFERYNKTDTFYAYNENADSPVMNRDGFIDKLQFDFKWPVEATNNRRRYFNAGVMLFGKDSLGFFDNFGKIPVTQALLEFGDQTYLNYLLAMSDKTKFESLDYSFNRMNLGERDDAHERYKANFIHYAGIDLYGFGDKMHTIEKDYQSLYGQ